MRVKKGWVPACLLLLSFSSLCMAEVRMRFTTIDFPGAIQTNPFGINNRGTVVGYYVAEDKGIHGFLWKQGIFTQLDFPGSTETYAMGINDKGAIVGYYYAPERHGFLYQNGLFTQLDFPDASSTNARAINNDGDIIGQQWGPEGPSAWILRAGIYEKLPNPQLDIQRARGINDAGSIVGFYFTSVDPDRFVAYLYNNGVFAYYDFPGDDDSMVIDVNNAGALLGNYLGGEDFIFNVLWSGVEWIILPAFQDYVGPDYYTQYLSMNDQGLYVGIYGPSDNSVVHGFLGTEIGGKSR